MAHAKKGPLFGGRVEIGAEVVEGVLLVLVKVKNEEEVVSEAGGVIVRHIGADDGQQVGAGGHM